MLPPSFLPSSCQLYLGSPGREGGGWALQKPWVTSFLLVLTNPPDNTSYLRYRASMVYKSRGSIKQAHPQCTPNPSGAQQRCFSG